MFHRWATMRPAMLRPTAVRRPVVILVVAAVAVQVPASGTNPAGSLKPETDSNFDKSRKENETYDEFDRAPARRRENDLDRPLDPADSQARKRPAVDPDPVDDFRSRPMGGTAADDAFELDPAGDQIKNKPPMDDSAVDIPPVDSADPAAPKIEPAPGTGDTESFPGHGQEGKRFVQSGRTSKFFPDFLQHVQ
jgi:hypothetical protein